MSAVADPKSADDDKPCRQLQTVQERHRARVDDFDFEREKFAGTS